MAKPSGSGGPSSSSTTSLIQMLDCPVCFHVLTPPIFLCQLGHSICSSCRNLLVKCPQCQSAFTNTRNVVVEQLVGTIKEGCTYSKVGCPLSFSANEWEEHVENCEFRPVVCNMLQRKQCCDVKVNRKNFFGHLKDVHNVRGVKGTIININQFVTYEQSQLISDMPLGMWPMQYLEGCNETFLTGTCVLKGKIFWWIQVIGGNDVAEKFVAKISLTLKDKLYDLSWTGPVHSYRTGAEDVLKQGLCLVATKESLTPFVCVKVPDGDGGKKNGEGSESGDAPSLNVGWSLTYSVMKKEKLLAPKKPVAPVPPPPVVWKPMPKPPAPQQKPVKVNQPKPTPAKPAKKGPPLHQLPPNPESNRQKKKKAAAEAKWISEMSELLEQALRASGNPTTPTPSTSSRSVSVSSSSSVLTSSTTTTLPPPPIPIVARNNFALNNLPKVVPPPVPVVPPVPQGNSISSSYSPAAATGPFASSSSGSYAAIARLTTTVNSLKKTKSLEELQSEEQLQAEDTKKKKRGRRGGKKHKLKKDSSKSMSNLLRSEESLD